MRYPNVVLLAVCVALAGCGVPSEQAAVQAPIVATAQIDQPAPSADTLPSPTLPEVQAETQPTATTDQQPNAPQPPACVFSGAAPAARPVLSLDAYSFATPRTVLEGSNAAISQWLPDNQRLLVRFQTPNGQDQSIATLDVQTGTTEQYVQSSALSVTRPIWLAAEQAVAFTQVLPDRRQAVLKLAYGSHQQRAIEDVATTIESPFISADAEGTRITVASASGQPQMITTNAAQRQVTRLGAPDSSTSAQSLPTWVGFEPWEARRTAWSPDSQHVVVYNKHGTALVDVQTGTTCGVQWSNEQGESRWALDVQWSPDGQSIAALTSPDVGKDQPPSIVLTVFDSTTGQVRDLDLGIQYVYELGWLPTGQQLVALGRVGIDEQNSQANLKLMLVDAQTGAYRNVLPDSTFRSGTLAAGNGGLAVAPDGSRIAARCAVLAPDGTHIDMPSLCVVDIQVPR